MGVTNSTKESVSALPSIAARQLARLADLFGDRQALAKQPGRSSGLCKGKRQRKQRTSCRAHLPRCGGGRKAQGRERGVLHHGKEPSHPRRRRHAASWLVQKATAQRMPRTLRSWLYLKSVSSIGSQLQRQDSFGPQASTHTQGAQGRTFPGPLNLCWC